jgi:hypothetical protein
MNNWRLILARLPLPMLALAASYGVYSFAQLFVPLGVAIIQAAAFELTYIGLAVTRDLSKDDRRRATTISIGAVVASIIYNTLAGWFHKQPALLETASPIAWLMFAILHGAPLAWVAYLVADLLLHSSAQTTLETLPARLEATEAPDQATAPVLAAHAQEQATEATPLEAPPTLLAAPYLCDHCGSELSSKQAKGNAARFGCANPECPGRSNRKEVRKAA